MPAASGPKTLILDLYGAYGRKLGDWFAVADLVALMSALGQDEQAVRSAIWRMTRRDVLSKEQRGGANGYTLNPEVREAMELGDVRIYGPLEPARIEDGWVMVSFSVPEEERQNRYLLRSRLEWLGYGNASNGLWIAPSHVLAETKKLISRMGLEKYVDIWLAHFQGFGELQAVIERAWDLKAIDDHYSNFAGIAEATVSKWRRRTPGAHPEETFVDYTAILHEWRKLPFLDPGLPAELLPEDWTAWTAREMFEKCHSQLEEAAFDFVRSVVDAHD